MADAARLAPTNGVEEESARRDAAYLVEELDALLEARAGRSTITRDEMGDGDMAERLHHHRAVVASTSELWRLAMASESRLEVLGRAFNVEEGEGDRPIGERGDGDRDVARSREVSVWAGSGATGSTADLPDSHVALPVDVLTVLHSSKEERTLNQVERVARKTIRVHYPAGDGEMVLRTELDWERDVVPVEVGDDGATSTFELETTRQYLYFKPCLRARDGAVRWAVGSNVIALMTNRLAGDVYPHFDGSAQGSFSNLVEIDSVILGRKHLLRVYLPPGYRENPLRRYSVVYMQDGKNLFFPEEAFLGREWRVDEVLGLLDSASAVDRVLVVGIYSADRMIDYTKPGYEAYARSVVEEVRPVVAERLRILDSPGETAVAGSSLGGVVSFYMAWQYPEVFGYAACMSSTFSYRDDLIERVLSEPKSSAKFYIDSGWPEDNYEATLAMAMALVERGYRPREDFLHLVFPLEQHDEGAWGRRLHLPLQLALGRPGLAHRRRVV
jgi:predicted alpha/beta superfamily hydrolase